MPDFPDWTLAQWIGASAGIFGAGYVAGLARAYVRKLLSTA